MPPTRLAGGGRVRRRRGGARIACSVGWKQFGPAPTAKMPAPTPVPAQDGPRRSPMQRRHCAEVVAIAPAAASAISGRLRLVRSERHRASDHRVIAALQKCKTEPARSSGHARPRFHSVPAFSRSVAPAGPCVAIAIGLRLDQAAVPRPARREPGRLRRLADHLASSSVAACSPRRRLLQRLPTKGDGLRAVYRFRTPSPQVATGCARWSAARRRAATRAHLLGWCPEQGAVATAPRPAAGLHHLRSAAVGGVSSSRCARHAAATGTDWPGMVDRHERRSRCSAARSSPRSARSCAGRVARGSARACRRPAALSFWRRAAPGCTSLDGACGHAAAQRSIEQASDHCRLRAGVGRDQARCCPCGRPVDRRSQRRTPRSRCPCGRRGTMP